MSLGKVSITKLEDEDGNLVSSVREYREMFIISIISCIMEMKEGVTTLRGEFGDNCRILGSEVVAQFRKLKDGKAPRRDGMNIPEMLKYGQEFPAHFLTGLYNQIMEGAIPEGFEIPL